MNLKELIKFGMEESQEPVIKNPFLRQALEPRTVDQGPRNMADGGRIGFSKGLSARTENLITMSDLSKLDLPYSEATLSNIFSSPDRNKNLKKIFKDNGIKIHSKGKRNMLVKLMMIKWNR